ncbi:MAG: translocation/assembly module TamB [Blastocatellales bacterium]|nr:translocation/assembly module TamB [Blastocatellales bacterium]
MVRRLTRRRIIIGSLVTVALLGAAALIALIAVRMGYIDRLIVSSLKSTLADYGVRAELDSLHATIRGLSVEARGVRLYTEGAAEPFATVERATLAVDLRDVLGWSGPTEINLRDCAIEGLRARYEIDAEGRSNLAGLRLPESRSQQYSYKYNAATLTLRDAEFVYLDRLHKLDATAHNISVDVSPSDNERMKLAASSRASHFVYDGRKSENLDIDLLAQVGETGARIESLKINGPLVAAELSGTLRDWREFGYELDASADVRLRDLGALLDPGLRLGGALRIDGKVEGAGLDYRATGRLRGDGLLVRGVRLDGLVLNAAGAGRGREAKARTDFAIRMLEAAGFRVNRFSAVGDFTGGESNFSWLGTLRAGSFTGAGSSGENLRIERARLNGPIADPTRTRLSGVLHLESLMTADVPVGDISGELVATIDEVEIPAFSGTVFGGEARGSARLRLDGRGASEFIADLSGLDLDQTLAAAAGRRLPLRGTTEGAVNLRWMGSDIIGTTEGAINLRFSGDTTAGASGLPVNGILNVIATGGAFRLDNTVVRTGASELRANGTVDWNGASDLDVVLTARDAAQLQGLVVEFADAAGTDAARELVATLKDSEIELRRALRFQGRVTGPIEDVQVNGRFALDSLSVGKEDMGQLAGDLFYCRQSARIDNGRLRQARGGRADFTVEYPFVVENSVWLRAQFADLSVRPLVNIFADLPVDGLATGKADLAGLPREMRGTAEVVLAEAGYDGRDVDEARARLRFDGSRINAEELRARIGQGVITGAGWYETQTKGYSVDLRGEVGEIAELIDADRSLPFDLTGSAEILIEAASAGFRRERAGVHRVFDNVSARIASNDLKYNGEALGRAGFTVSGRDSRMQFELNAELLGQNYAGEGTIDFTQYDAPVRARVVLGDVAMAPVLDLVTGRRFSTPGTVAGEVRASGSLFGDSNPLQLEAELSKLAFESREAPIAAQPPVLLRFQGQQLDLGRIRLSGPETNLELAGVIGFEGDGRLSLTANGDLNLRIAQNFVKDVAADGIVRVQMAAGGSFQKPRLSGSATLEGGSVRRRDFPLNLSRANGRLLFTADQAQIASLTAEVGGGRLSITGGAALAGFAPDRWRLQARASNVRLDYPRDVRSTVDGDFTLQGNRRLQVLSGAATVRRAEYLAETDLFDFIERVLSEVGVGGGQDLTAAAGWPPTQLDLRVVANDSIIINNRSLDVVAGADLRLIGSLDDPQIKGRLAISRGLIDDLFRERYRITSGVIEFSGISERPPRLSVEAETVISGYRLSVLIAGPFDNLRITPRSEPPLPQSDVITLMTTGQLPRDGLSADSPTQALAQTQAQNLSTLLAQPLSSRIGSNVTGRLFGLNRFAIDPLVTGRGTDPTARITVGRRVTKDLSITYSTNLASNQDQVILIEYRASDRLSFVASRAQDGAFGLDVRLRKRF